MASVPEHYWLHPGRLAGGQWPGPDLDWLASLGVTAVVNLTPTAYEDPRFRVHQIPIDDWAAPVEAEIARFCRVVHGELAAGRTVYVHCVAGCGRTGTMMACYLVYRERADPGDAIARVRALRPCSVETMAQVDAVRRWAVIVQAADHGVPP